MEKSMDGSKNGKDSGTTPTRDDQDTKTARANVERPAEDSIDSITSEIVFQVRKRLEEFTTVAANQRFPPRFTRSVNLDYRASDALRLPNRILSGHPSIASEVPFEDLIAPSRGKVADYKASEANLVALSKAFRVVRRILLSVSELLQQFSNRLNTSASTTATKSTEWAYRWPSRMEPERTEIDTVSSEKTSDSQYNQYVYQIVFYLLEILGEQLNNFGTLMNFTSSQGPPNVVWKGTYEFAPDDDLWSSDSEESGARNEPRKSDVLSTEKKASDKIKSLGRESLKRGRKISDGIKKNIGVALEIVCDVFSNVFGYLTEDSSREPSRAGSQKTESLSTRDNESHLSSEDVPEDSPPEKVSADCVFIRGSKGDVASKIRDFLSGSNQGLFDTTGDRFYPESASTASSRFYGNRMEDLKNTRVPALPLCDTCQKERDKVLDRNRANSVPVQKVSTAEDGEKKRALSDYISDKIFDIKPIYQYITADLSDKEGSKEDSNTEYLQGVPVNEKRATSAQTQTSSESQAGRITVMDRASLAEAARSCANRIIDDLIQIANIISLGDEDSRMSKCAECDAIIYIDLSELPTNGSYGNQRISPNFDDLLYNPGESDDPKCPCKGFYMLPSDARRRTSSSVDWTRDSSGFGELAKTDAPVVNILSLDLNQFTKSLRKKFREVLSITETDGETNTEECLDSSFVNEKAILRILLECCRQASQTLKEPGLLLQEEYCRSEDRASSNGRQLSEVYSDESMDDEFADGVLCGFSNDTPVDRVRRDTVDLKRANENLEEGRVEFFSDCKVKESCEVSSRHLHTSVSSSKYPNHRVRFVSDVKESDGPSLSRSHGEHLDDVGFYFSEIDSDLSYMWDESDDRRSSDFLEPHPHVIIHQEDQFPPNVLEIREALNGRVYRRLEEWHEESENFTSGEWWRIQNNIANRGVPLHHVPERTQLPVHHSGIETGSPVKVSRGDHSISPTSMSRSSGLAFVKPPKQPESECKASAPSMNTSSWPGNYPFTAEDAKRRSSTQAPSGEWNLLCKVWQFLEERKKDGYGRGPPLVLILHRHCAVEEAFDALMFPSALPLHYYRDLRVTFKDQQEREERHDASQELFSFLAHQLFSKYHYGLFDHPSFNSLALYLNPASRAEAQWFQFAGVVLALALLHQKQMGMILPASFFKCILDRPFTINDVKEVDPDLYENLIWLKHNKVSGISPPLTFVIRDKYGDTNYDFELIPEGSSVCISDVNKFGYIEKAIKWKLAERCFCQIKEFRRGFLSILEPHMLFIFTADELQHLIARTAEDGPLGDDMNTPVRRCTW